MIVTEEFVFLNLPKTGSTFVREVFQRLKNRNIITKVLKDSPRIEFLKTPNIRDFSTFRLGMLDDHGIRYQVPHSIGTKKIVSIKRNIFERIVSVYEYKDWIKAPWLDNEIISREFREYPNLSFKAFIKLMYSYPPHFYDTRFDIGEELGFISFQLIQFFSKNPFKSFKGMNWKEERLIQEIKQVEFLENQDLNNHLFNFLKSNGFHNRDIDFIKVMEKSNISRPNKKSWESYYTDETIELIYKKEWFTLKLFPEYRLN